MKKQTPIILTLTIISMMILSACNLPLPPEAAASEKQSTGENVENENLISSSTATTAPALVVEATVEETPETSPEQTETPEINETNSQVETSEQIVLGEVGPEDFPEGINPLTGLPAADPGLLKLPPGMVSISNFPSSARPQAGLNASPIVFEITVGEGMTRFLAMFYGQFPEQISGQTDGQSPGSDTESGENENETAGSDNETATASQNMSIGPIRSGRLPYEDIRSLYTGFLVMASADEGVSQNLNQASSVYGSDSEDINSAMIDVRQLQKMAESRSEGYPGSDFNLEGMKFSQTPPDGGQSANWLWVFYSARNQVQWQYDPEMGAYIRYDIKTDGSSKFLMSTDRLTGEPVTKENVIVIFAEHDYRAPTLIDIDMLNKPPMKALLLRDGEIHEIFWTTRFGEYEKTTGLSKPMRFVDADGNPVSLKHGQTWISVVSLSSYHKESRISDAPFYPVVEEQGTGLWLVRYKGKY